MLNTRCEKFNLQYLLLCLSRNTFLFGCRYLNSQNTACGKIVLHSCFKTERGSHIESTIDSSISLSLPIYI